MNIKPVSDASAGCFVCSHPLSQESHAYNDIGWTDYGIFSDLRVYHCDACGFGFSAPELPDKIVADFYENQYRAKTSTFYIDFNKPVSQRISDVRNDRVFSQIMLGRVHCEFDPGDVFLDIGPGGGSSFAMAKALLPQPELCAIELSLGASQFYRKNYDAASHPSLNDFRALGKRAKIILMSHSLEHYRLSELNESFAVIAKALADDGVVVIEVPHVDLRIHSEIRGVDTPHFLFFSKESLALLLGRLGFDVLFVDTCCDEHKTPAVQKMVSNSFHARIKNYLKPGYNKLPCQLQSLLRTFVRAFRRAGNLTGSFRSKTDSFAANFYGGNRVCVRLVARKKFVR